MNFLEERIERDGVVREGNILKVDSFLNHQIDIQLLNRIGREFLRRFSAKEVTKILTIEASGIGIACVVAQYFDVPVLFAKKSPSANVDDSKISARSYSFTHKCENTVFVSAKYLSPDDKVLIIDDFLAQGSAALALCSIVEQAGATVQGIGIAIEKGFQSGGDQIRSKGYQLESIAIVESMDASTGTITFRD